MKDVIRSERVYIAFNPFNSFLPDCLEYLFKRNSEYCIVSLRNTDTSLLVAFMKTNDRQKAFTVEEQECGIILVVRTSFFIVF